MQTRTILVALTLAACGVVVAAIFWQNEMRYALPTPIPIHYKPVLLNDVVSLPGSKFQKDVAQYLHFYDPDCPCSRFNAMHIKSLIADYSKEVRASIIVFDGPARLAARKEFGAALPIILDVNREIAAACGVYSTPQAAIVNADSKLYYRGNYNKSRFCTTRATNFAELALVSLINKQPPPQFGLLATQSLGCQLPTANLNEEFF